MKTTLILALLLGCASTLHAQREVPHVQSIDQKLQTEIQFLNPKYLVFSPKLEAETKLPLLIYLHGAGGRGDQIIKVKGQAMSVWRGIERFGKGPCIVVAPQCLNITKGDQRSTWTAADLNIFLRHLKATLPIDATRIYLTGNSMGGYGTWMWGAANPEHFAAIAPVSGGTGRGGPKDVSPKLAEWAKNLAKIPVYAFAGAKDTVVPPARSESLIKAIRDAGGEQAKLKVYPDQGHNARAVVYTSGEFYEWLFAQRRE